MKHAALVLFAAGLSQAAISLSGVEIYSKETVKYGRWEIRMKIAAAPGTVSSFFTYNNSSYMGDPHPWREIDIEALGNKPKGFQSNIITGDASSKTTSEEFHAAEDLSKGFHTYVLDWSPDSVVWKLDGETVRKSTDDQVTDMRDSTQGYRMNLWASNSAAWVGKLDTTQLPVLQVVNWISYSKYTPGAGPDGSDFTPAWSDDFTTLDKKRWSFGNWTFDGNYATFTSENARVADGYLTLMLSTVATEGIFPASIPTDSIGSVRPSTSIAARRAAALATPRALGGGRLLLEVPKGGAWVVDSQGRELARVERPGSATLTGLPRGIALVRSGSHQARTVLIE